METIFKIWCSLFRSKAAKRAMKEFWETLRIRIRIMIMIMIIIIIIIMVYSQHIHIKGCGSSSVKAYNTNYLILYVQKICCLKKYSICDILTTRDSILWNKITSNSTALDDLLPPKRTNQLCSRGHD